MLTLRWLAKSACEESLPPDGVGSDASAIGAAFAGIFDRSLDAGVHECGSE
jgi:hypothetical protein